MTPFRFRVPQQKLYGVLHAGGSFGAQSRAVLLCNPFGQEAVRTHRLYRVIADRLAQRGIHAMRFDYFGTGESDGDDDQGDLPRWAMDVVAADAELRRRTQAGSIVWFGSRLGASIAALASRSVSAVAPAAMVMWEPVINGPAYWSELQAVHARILAENLPRLVAQSARVDGSELIGFGVNSALEKQIGTIDIDRMGAMRAGRLAVLSSAADASAASLVERTMAGGLAAQLNRMESALDWTSEEAINHALVPAEPVRQLVAMIEAEANA